MAEGLYIATSSTLGPDGMGMTYRVVERRKVLAPDVGAELAKRMTAMEAAFDRAFDEQAYERDFIIKKLDTALAKVSAKNGLLAQQNRRMMQRLADFESKIDSLYVENALLLESIRQQSFFNTIRRWFRTVFKNKENT